MSDAHFSLIFEGRSVDNGEIDVQDLAPSLLALGALIQAANAELNGASSRMAVKVQTTRAGSFQVDMMLVQSLAEQAASLLSFLSDHKDGLAAADTLADIILKVGAGVTGVTVTAGGGLLAFLKWLRGRRPSRIEKVAGEIHVYVDDTVFITNPQTIALAENREVREQARRLVSVLDRDGIDSIAAQRAGQERLTLAKPDVPSFNIPEAAEEVLAESEYTRWLQIDSLSFKEGNKWRLTDGGEPFFAVIEDAEFLARIDRREIAFAKADGLQCLMRERQSITGKGTLKKEITVLRVLEHRSGAKQLKLL